MSIHKKHQWLPYFYKAKYVGDGKNVNYILTSVYCPECGLVEEISNGKN